jgi:cation diffusion facilitator CzcD-associated flavoprotein CzcO
VLSPTMTTAGPESPEGRTSHEQAIGVLVGPDDAPLPQVPALAQTFPDRVAQYHTADYRGVWQLPAGTVLVVGSAQSGCQIAEDLLAGGRRVLLATSPVGRVPFRHRGRESVEWLVEAGFRVALAHPPPVRPPVRLPRRRRHRRRRGQVPSGQLTRSRGRWSQDRRWASWAISSATEDGTV